MNAISFPPNPRFPQYMKGPSVRPGQRAQSERARGQAADPLERVVKTHWSGRSSRAASPTFSTSSNAHARVRLDKQATSSTLSDCPDRRDPARHDTDGKNPLFALQSRIWISPLYGNRGKRAT